MTTFFISHSSIDIDWAKELKAFLEADEPGRGYQAVFLDVDSEDGLYPGVQWEQGLYQNLRQARAVIALCTRDWVASAWCMAEAMIAREKNRPLIPLVTDEVVTDDPPATAKKALAPRLPNFLKDTQYIRVKGKQRRQAHDALLAGLARLELWQQDFPLPDRPYPGLNPFTGDDAAVFFSRDREIDEVKGMLDRRARNDARCFVLVLDASGSGKSSLVQAGVVPQVARTRIPKKMEVNVQLRRGNEWVVPPPFPAGQGLQGLGESLGAACQAAGRPKAECRTREIREQIAPNATEGDDALMTAAIQQAAGKLDGFAQDLLDDLGCPAAHLLLVLDQLEEVFGTHRAKDSEALLRLLLAAASGYHGKIVVLATMRSDYLNAFQTFRSAADGYEAILLDPMSTSRFGEVIRGPAGRFGFGFDPEGLPDRLVRDAEADDALPLLAHALQKLYERCGPAGPLTGTAYEMLFPPVTVTDPETQREKTYQGVAASIKKTADDILREHHIDPKNPADSGLLEHLRRAFYMLAQVGESGQIARRTASWSNIPAAAKPVLDSFMGRRLLTKGSEPRPDGMEEKETVSVTHEALFRVWDVLRGWLEADRAVLALRKQVRAAALQWWDSDYSPNRLWNDDRVIESIQELAHSGVQLGDDDEAELLQRFLGPTAQDELETLPFCTNEKASRYGDFWRLPLSHEARARVGDRLAQLGDRRPGVGLRADGRLPDIGWCLVALRNDGESEEVTLEIRSNPGDRSSEVKHTVSQKVGRFWIARYPVTVSQFRAFLDHCYVDGRWRLPGSAPQLPDDYPPPKPRARHGNRPMDSVNWYDATLFCAWLSDQLGYEVRLPTEFEWQYAATGGDQARMYPWANDWDVQQASWFANTVESELGRSTAVGLYPHGAAPTGALDMAGSLSEWCLNAFDEPNDSDWPESNEHQRALRGGSWDFDQAWARCATRDHRFPDVRNINFGFRVLCSSPIPDH